MRISEINREMADEDEIDVLGDFSLDNLLSKSEPGIYDDAGLASHNSALSCDWLLAENATSDASSCLRTEDYIADESGWTGKEKSLLDRGIEIFGKSHVRLSQFIGSKTAAEVKHYLKNFGGDGVFYPVNVGDGTGVAGDSIVLNDSDIPASIEEVIASATTARTTVSVPRKVPKQRKTHGKSKLSPEVPKRGRRKNQSKAKFKFRAKIKVRPSSAKSNLIHLPPRSKVIENLGEEVLKINKFGESESDVEIDVENDEFQPSASVQQQVVEEPETPVEEEVEEKVEIKEEDYMEPTLEYSEAVTEQLFDTKPPQAEVVLSDFNVTDLEKAVFPEFFDGRATKTPSRYLKIRNNILNAWNASKPVYVTKTSIRPGLRNCGDVNCIGRIHHFLEQIGAINFGCSQTNYSRPLYNLISANNVVQKEKPAKEVAAIVTRPLHPRARKKFNNDGEGGCTLTHDEQGFVINTTIINEGSAIKRPYVKKPTIKLISCKPFTITRPQDYSVRLHLSALLSMDLHAHTSLQEVMGLLAGRWDENRQVLTITHYEPCKNLASSQTHCDMCPVSQAQAAEVIHGEGLNVLGWFHSHPTFAPEPSQQDLDTQLSLQQLIGVNRPCIGIILSPFWAQHMPAASPYRCLIVDKKVNFEDQYVPYRLKVELVSKNFDAELALEQAFRIFNSEEQVENNRRVNFQKPYFQDQTVTYLGKFLWSMKMNLAKCPDVNKMTCDALVGGLEEICGKR